MMPAGRVAVTTAMLLLSGCVLISGVSDFDVVEVKHELEYGFSDSLQIAGYLNWEWAHAHNNNVMDGSLPETLANVALDDPNQNFRMALHKGRRELCR